MKEYVDKRVTDMPIKATDTWLRTNFVGLIIGLVGIITTFTTINSRLEVVVAEQRNRAPYLERVQRLERDFILVKATQDASKLYWFRFEKLLVSNTSALNENSIVMSGAIVQLQDHARRIEKLEDVPNNKD